MRRVLLAERHQEPAEPHLELDGKAVVVRNACSMAIPSSVADAEEDVAAKVGIDGGLERDLDLADAEARAVFLRAALG